MMPDLFATVSSPNAFGVKVVGDVLAFLSVLYQVCGAKVRLALILLCS